MAVENLIKSEDIQIKAREIDFVTQFEKNWNHLHEILGITRPIAKQPGAVLKVKKASGKLEDGAVGEGELIPRSKFQVTEEILGEFDLEKFAKETSIEAIKDHGYDYAVGLTDEEFRFELTELVTKRFYDFLKTGETQIKENDFQMAVAMTLGKVQSIFKLMHRSVTGTALFVNTLDLYAYLGNADISLQTAFGMNYLTNFMGANLVFVTDEIPRGQVIGTPINNIISYYIDPSTSDFARAGLSYTVSGETNLIGYAVQPDYNHATTVAYALMGFKIFCEYLNGIVICSIDAEAEDTESAGKTA